MRRQRHELKQKGFTLISTMIAVGIASVVILGLGTVLTQMFRVLKSAEVMGDGTDFIGQIRMNFDDPDRCDAAFGSGGFSFNASGSGGGVTSLSGLPLVIQGTTTPFTPGKEIVPGLTLKSIDLVTLTKFADREAVSLKGASGSPVTAYRYQGLVRIQVTRHTGTQTIEQPPSFVPVTFSTSSSGASGSITGCGSTTISQATCESLNYVWDTAAKKCIQANECSYGGSFANTGGVTGSFTNPFTGGFSCPADAQGQPYDQIRSGSISWAVKSSKYGVTSNIYPVFSCMICKDANGKKTTFSATTLTAITNLGEAMAMTSDLPAGSYSASCTSCSYSASKTLKCTCKSVAGKWITSSLNTTSCAGDIANSNGYLSCPGVCSAAAPCYTKMCGGTVTCSPGGTSGGYTYPPSCSETCSYGGGYYGGFYYQTFDASGHPNGAPIYIPPFYGPFF